MESREERLGGNEKVGNEDEKVGRDVKVGGEM